MKQYTFENYTYTTDNTIEPKAGMWCVDIAGEQIFKMGNAFETYPESIKDFLQTIMDNTEVITATDNPTINLNE
jgi:hypothetical protein